jgi:ParB family chromosome partitioning protein
MVVHFADDYFAQDDEARFSVAAAGKRRRVQNTKKASKGRRMTTTVAAGHPGEKEKEKTEKRRALGRGLESLLPGPRIVTGGAASPAGVPRVGAGTAATVPRATDNISAPGRDVAGNVSTELISLHGVVDESAERTAETASVPTSTPAPSVVSRAGAPAPHEIATHETITLMAQAESRTPGNLVIQIPLNQIDANPHQTRYEFDEELLEELAQSIQANGVVQPIVVRPGEDGRYVLILGERRCRASKLAGKTTVPAIVRRVSEQQAAEMTIVENLQREDLNCLEQAAAFAKLSQEFGMTQQQIGDRVGLSRESVSNYMRLLKLPGRVMEYLKYNKLSFSQAREMLALDNPQLIERVADEAVKKNLTDEQIEDLVAKLNGWPSSNPGLPEPKPKGAARWVDPNVRAAQRELESILGLRVRIRDRKGKGKIVIEYATVDDYDRVVGMLRGK